MRVADQEKTFGPQLVEKIREPAGHRFFVELPDELERLLIDERAVRNTGNFSEEMKDSAMRRTLIMARNIAERGIRRVSKNVISRRVQRFRQKRIDSRADEEPQRLDRREFPERLGHRHLTV